MHPPSPLGETARTDRARRAKVLAALTAAAVAFGLALAAPASADTVTIGDRAFDREYTPIDSLGYQVAYSETNDLIWTTSVDHTFVDGVPYATSSTIVAVDPDTGEVVTTIVPRALENPTRVEAAYGIGVDEANNQIWTTSTRENSVVIYDQATGERVAAIEGIAHARDVRIDPYRGTAFVSSPIPGALYEIDTTTYEVVTLTADYLGLSAFTPIGIDLVATPDTSLLYTVNHIGGDLIELDHLALANRVVATFPGGADNSGVAVDPSRGLAYVVSQGAQTLRTVDIADGTVVNTVEHATGLLNVDVDPAGGLVYAVTSVHGHDVVLADADTGDAICSLDVGAEPNHVLVAAGKVWIADRGGWSDLGGGNSRLWHLTLTD